MGTSLLAAERLCAAVVLAVAVAGCNSVREQADSEVVLTIAGAAFAAAPLAGATVEARVGSKTYAATAAADGTYAVGLPESPADDPVVIVVHGAAAQDCIELASLLGSFAGVVTAAGEDGTLTRAELGAVQVTPATTARHAVLLAANGGQPPGTRAEVVAVEQDVGLVRTWLDAADAAGAIELVAESKRVLPAGFVRGTPSPVVVQCRRCFRQGAARAGCNA